MWWGPGATARAAAPFAASVPCNTADVTTLTPIVIACGDPFSHPPFASSPIAAYQPGTLPIWSSKAAYAWGRDLRRQKKCAIRFWPTTAVPRGPRTLVDSTDPRRLTVKECGLRSSVMWCFEPGRRSPTAHVERLWNHCGTGSRAYKALVATRASSFILKWRATHFAIDEESYIRKLVTTAPGWLRTNTDWPASEVALQYKNLLLVEQLVPRLQIAI